MFAYCDNNPINKFDTSGTWPKWLNNIADRIVGNAKRLINSLTYYIKSKKRTYRAINHVKRTHVTTPELMLDLGGFIGKVGFSTTVNKEDEYPGFVHAISDIGNDSSEYSVGLNFIDIVAVDIGCSDELNVFVNVQISQWAHGKISGGADGIGLTLGFDVDDISYDFNIKGGWGLILIFVTPELITASLQMGGRVPT